MEKVEVEEDPPEQSIRRKRRTQRFVDNIAYLLRALLIGILTLALVVTVVTPLVYNVFAAPDKKMDFPHDSLNGLLKIIVNNAAVAPARWHNSNSTNSTRT